MRATSATLRRRCLGRSGAVGCDRIRRATPARAESLSFTHDESLSYLNYVKRPISSVLSRETDANNHPLNTSAMKLGDALFGPDELALRWSAVLAFVVYAVALVIILRHVERLSIRVLGLLLGLANPYVLDFFLARGYGLALAAVAVSVVFTLGYVERPRPRGSGRDGLWRDRRARQLRHPPRTSSRPCS